MRGSVLSPPNQVAVLLLQTHRPAAGPARDHVGRHELVTDAVVTSGPYDVIALVRSQDRRGLEAVLDHARGAPG